MTLPPDELPGHHLAPIGRHDVALRDGAALEGVSGRGPPARNAPEREERDMTSTTGTTTTSRTRTNKRSTSRITGLKAVSEQVNEAYCNSGVRAQLTTPLRNLQPPRGVRCRMSECRSKEELAPPAEGAPSLRPDHPIW